MILLVSVWLSEWMACVTSQTEAVGHELNNFRLLRDHLLLQIPDIDPETLADTLEGITDLREMLAEIIRSALDDEALAAGPLHTSFRDEGADRALRDKRQAQARACA